MSIAQLLAKNRTEDSYLAGGAALHIAPNSQRYSNDLDYFHDSVVRVASAFADDERLLTEAGYSLQLEMNQPGFIRSIVTKNHEATKIEWAHDSAWRYLPPIKDENVGIQLHPIDLAVNKVLALAGRDEARDFLDILYIHKEILSLPALLWAAVGKDPGFTPLSLLEVIKRRGRYRPEDFNRLLLTKPVDLVENKTLWLSAIRDADDFILHHAPKDYGCLFYSPASHRFVTPTASNDAVPHYGVPGGVLPRFFDN
jgi:hypothetical protein